MRPIEEERIIEEIDRLPPRVIKVRIWAPQNLPAKLTKDVVDPYISTIVEIIQKLSDHFNPKKLAETFELTPPFSRTYLSANVNIGSTGLSASMNHHDEEIDDLAILKTIANFIRAMIPSPIDDSIFSKSIYSVSSTLKVFAGLKREGRTAIADSYNVCIMLEVYLPDVGMFDVQVDTWEDFAGIGRKAEIPVVVS